MALKALYGPQQAANLYRRRDRRPVRHFGDGERTFQVSRYIAVGASRRNRVTEDLATGCANALGGFVTAPHFDCAKDSEQCMR